MVMITPQYETFYGSIERVGKGSVQTLFYHFMGLPLFPQDTYWVEGNPLTSYENLKVMELGRSWPSIAAGYLRGWSTVGSIYLICIGVALWFMPPPQILPGEPLVLGHSVWSPVVVALGLGGLAAAVAVWFFTRRPIEGDEAAKRGVFQSFFGVPIDPRLLHGDVSMNLHGQGLLNDLVQAAYQAGLGRHDDLKPRWTEWALDPRIARPDLLRLATTIARFQQGEAKADQRTRLVQLEEQLWQRLVSVDPSVRQLRPTAA